MDSFLFGFGDLKIVGEVAMGEEVDLNNKF
jgi:hypothetical protein